MKHAKRARRVTSLMGSLGLAMGLLVLPGCGGSDSGPAAPTPTPPPTPPPPRVVLERGGVTLASGFATGDSFTTDRAGTIDAIIDYTFTTSPIIVWIARGLCTGEQFGAEQCTFAATSFAGPKPRRVSVTNASAGTYTLVVGNAGSEDEAISYQVVLTPSAAAASSPHAHGQPAPARGRYLFRLP